MQTLEYLYEENHKNSFFIDRKLVIEHKKVLLKGVRKCGKTHVIFDHLQQYEKERFLYIDWSDERIDKREIMENLAAFCRQKALQLLIIDGYDFSFTLPPVEEMILSTNLTCKDLQGFQTYTLYPLDFEEFLAFEKKYSNIEHLFNVFTNRGTFPEMVQNSESYHVKALQEMLHIMLPEPNAYFIYQRFCELQGHKVSLFQIYNHLKMLTKISKDKVYALTANLIDQQLIFLVEKYQQPNAPKKSYLIDFTFKNALSFKKDFIRQFENMVFLELRKRHEPIFYEEGIDFYLPKDAYAVLCVGFATKEMIEIKLQKLLPTFWSLHVKKIDVVTLSSESAQDIEGFSFTILPFWEWALQL